MSKDTPSKITPATILDTTAPEGAPKPSAIRVMGERLNVDPKALLATLKDTVFKGAKDSELASLAIVSNEYGLNPFLKQIFAFPAKGGGIVPVVSIDGWLKIINEHPQFDGLETVFVDGENGKPVSATTTIYRKDRKHPTVITEYYVECFVSSSPVWKTMPRRMLRHKSIIQCARVAFGLSGIYDRDEGLAISTGTVPGIHEADGHKAEAVAVLEALPEPSSIGVPLADALAKAEAEDKDAFLKAVISVSPMSGDPGAWRLLPDHSQRKIFAALGGEAAGSPEDDTGTNEPTPQGDNDEPSSEPSPATGGN